MTDQPIRLLIVDDSALLRRQLCAFLGSRFRFAIAEAASAAEAAAQVNAARPDIALVDVQLPDGSGLTLGRTLRAQAVAVILMSRFDCAEYRAVAATLPAAFIAKDNLLRPLVQALRATLTAIGREESVTLYCRVVPIVGFDAALGRIGAALTALRQQYPSLEFAPRPRVSALFATNLVALAIVVHLSALSHPIS